MSTSVLSRPEQPAARTYPAYSRPLWRRVLLTREFAVIALLVAVFFYSNNNVPNFDGPLTLYYLFLDMAPILLIALPMTLVIITGEIDLSVASVVGLSSVLVGMLHQDAGMSIPAAAAVAIVVGAVCGAFNGFLVAYVGLPSLAVTIGTLALYRGIAVGLLGTKAVTDFPEKWTDLAKERIVDESSYPVILIPFVVLADRLRAAAALLVVRPRHLRDRPELRGRALLRRQRGAHQVLAVRAGRRGLRRSPASTTRCASAAPAATTPPGSSSR